MSDLSLLNEKIVILWSGGLDSTGLIKIILNNYEGEIFPIFLKHGQRNTEYELKSVEHYTKIFLKDYDAKFNEPFIVTTDIPAQEFKKYNFESKIYLRNSDMINNAIRFAAGKNISTIVLATFDYDMGDGQPKFFKIKEQETEIATPYKVRIFSPFFEIGFPCNTKSELIDYCNHIGFDLSHTRSCYESSETPCKQCQACEVRQQAYDLRNI